MVLVDILVLLLIANGAPILARLIFGKRLLTPVDYGRYAVDGRRLLGPSKTLLGVAAAIVVTAVAANLLGYGFWLGALTGMAAMAGDLLSSYCKRRLGMPPSAFAPGLDQIPESLLPALALMRPLGLLAAEIVLIVAAFVVLELGLSALLYKLHIRQQPY